MTNINRIYATLLLIRHTVVPVKKGERSFQLPVGSGILRIPPEAFAAVLLNLGFCLRPEGEVELLFEGALAPAAPFLLFHLKRKGFSDCKAVISPEGIKLTVRR